MSRQFLFIVLFLFMRASADIQGFATDGELSMEHLQEHYKNKLDSMANHNSPKDRQFYYFQIGDTNGDHALDGIELYKMIGGHSHDDNKPTYLDAESIEVQVDQVLGEMDRDNDGIISISEYKRKFARG